MLHQELLEKELPKKCLVIFKGSIDPETNQNWCSDCVKAQPNIDNVIIPYCEEKNITVFIVEVGLRP